MWIGLVTVCLMGVASVTDKHARDLTASTAWAADQLINTVAGMLGAGIASWISDHRFAIATAVLLLAVVDLLGLAMIRAMHEAARHQPRVRLGDWMEMPLPVAPPVSAPTRSGVEILNRKVAAATTVAAASLLTATLTSLIWARSVLVPRGASRLAHAAVVGGVQSRAGLDSLRDAAAHIQFAARAWYTAAGAPAVSGLAGKAAGAVRGARAEAQTTTEPTSSASGQLVDIQAVLGLQSLGWYGPLSPVPDMNAQGEEDGAEQRPDRLAS